MSYKCPPPVQPVCLCVSVCPSLSQGRGSCRRLLEVPHRNRPHPPRKGELKAALLMAVLTGTAGWVPAHKIKRVLRNSHCCCLALTIGSAPPPGGNLCSVWEGSRSQPCHGFLSLFPLSFSSSSSGALFALLWLHPAWGMSAARWGPPPRIGPASLSVGFGLCQQSLDRTWCVGCCYGLSSSTGVQPWLQCLHTEACWMPWSFHGDGQGSFPFSSFPFQTQNLQVSHLCSH